MMEPVTDRFWIQLRGVLCGLQCLPCDEWQVADIQEELRVDFPAAYKAFLLLAGRGCEPLEPSKYTIDDDLAGLQRSGRRIMQHENLAVPQDAFVFFVHQGFVCHFFLLDNGDDPSIYQCVEGMGPFQRIASTFSQWIFDQVARFKELRETRQVD